MRRVRTVIADDQPRSRAGLRALLTAWPEGEVVGEAATGQAAIELVRDERADLVLLDVKMPVLDGLEAARIIKRRWPSVRVVLLSLDDGYRRAADAAGADAFVPKGTAATQLLATLSAVSASPAKLPMQSERRD